jgi:anti-sigma28 factor (negative regulator of flagellin synthesis)
MKALKSKVKELKGDGPDSKDSARLTFKVAENMSVNIQRESKKVAELKTGVESGSKTIMILENQLLKCKFLILPPFIHFAS